jgi:hypothetical protein
MGLILVSHSQALKKNYDKVDKSFNIEIDFAYTYLEKMALVALSGLGAVGDVGAEYLEIKRSGSFEFVVVGCTSWVLIWSGNYTSERLPSGACL